MELCSSTFVSSDGMSSLWSAPAGAAARLVVAHLQVAADHTLVALERGEQVFDQLPPHALQRVHVGAQARLLAARGLHRLLAAQLRLPDDQVGLALGAGLHVVRETL